MSYDNTPLEALLRPASEQISAVTATAAAVMCALAPNAIMMTPSVGYASSAVLGCFAAHRYSQAHKIKTYQRNLRRLPSFTMKSKHVPWSHRKLYMGKGFQWEQKHTQRLSDARSRLGEDFTKPTALEAAARKAEIAFEKSSLLGWIPKVTTWDHWLNPVRPLPPVGGNPLLHGVEPDEDDVYFDLGERVGHQLVMGTTRVGKSRLAEVLISQDIARNDGPVIVVDPKGDAELMLRMYTEAKRQGREDDFVVFHLGFPDISARYNAIGNFSRVSEVASRSTNQLASEGNSSAFKEFAWRFVQIVSRALVGLGERPDYTKLTRYIQDMEPLFIRYTETYLTAKGPKDWASSVHFIESNMKAPPRHMQGRSKRSAALEMYLGKQKIFDPVVAGLLSSIRYDRTYFDKLTASFLPLMEKLTSGRLQELVSPDYDDVEDERPIIDWMKVIRKKMIVYVGLDAMTDQDVAQAVGNSMFADLVSTSGYLYKHGMEHGFADGRDNQLPKVYLHADEFSDLVGQEFKPLLNKSGGSGIRVTAYTQTRADVASGMGDDTQAKVLEGNFNTVIMLRVRSKETAEILIDQLPETYIHQITMVSGVNDSSNPDDAVHFTSKNEDRITQERVPMLETDALVNLPKGQAFALVEGSKLYKLRFPMLEDDKDDAPPALRELSKLMRTSYKTSDEWWKEGQTLNLVMPDEQPEQNPFLDVASFLSSTEVA